MTYVYLALAIIALILWLVAIRRMDTRARNKSKITAYKLLDMSNPDIKEVKKTIVNLRLYSGRWRRDEESLQLIRRIQEKYFKT